jgi:hypothetical protein
MVIIDHDGEVVAVAPKVAQQVVETFGFRNEHGGSQQRTDVELGGPLQLEQVFGHQDTNDVFAFALVDRKA